MRGRIDERVNRDVPVADLWQKFNQALPVRGPARSHRHIQCLAHLPGGRIRAALGTAQPAQLHQSVRRIRLLDDTSCNLASINVLFL
jgi:ribonucleoside-diphosphate reductase alpha chain